MPSPTAAWTGRSRGGACTVALFRFAVAILPIVGLRGAWLGSWLVAGIFLAAGGRRQFGVPAYWRRLRPRMSGWTLTMTLWRHYASFGRILCDRLLLYLAPDRYRLSHAGIDEPIAMIARRQGFIFLGAHVGNWEMAGLVLSRGLERIGARMPPVHVVMVRNEHPAVQAYGDARLRSGPVQAIDPRDPVAAAVAISSALARGEVVCMLGDRVLGGQPAIEVPFLGRRMRVPAGPFQAALITGAPIVPAFFVKTGFAAYHLDILPALRVRSPQRRERAAAVAAAARRWAVLLERQVRALPFQWHNFFDPFPGR